jgi:sensor histidine kinase YesM
MRRRRANIEPRKRNAMKRSWRWTLRKKMILGFLVFFIIPFFIFEFILFRSWLNTTRDIVVNRYETILNEAIDDLMKTIDNAEKMNDFIYRDYQRDAALFGKLASDADGSALRNDPFVNDAFTRLSNQYFSQFDEELEFSFLTMGGQLIYQRANRPVRGQFLNFLSNYGDEPWFRQVVENGPYNSVLSGHFSFFRSDDEARYFTFAQVIRSPFDLQPAGVSLLTVNAAVFRLLLENPSDQEWIRVIVTDGQGRLMYANGSPEIQPEQAHHILRRRLTPYDWEITAYLNTERLTRSYSSDIVRSNGWFLLTGILLAGAIILFLTRQLKPLYLLADKMKKAKSNQFRVKIANRTDDEIGMLCDIFNDMTAEIRELFRRQHLEYQEKLQLQMKALELQINPHFIYNMLDLIQSRIYEEEPDRASELIVTLSNILRYTTTHPGEKVVFTEEIKWLNDYLMLSRQLHGRRVNVRIDFEDRVTRCRIHKLILQPLIENAFIHGFKRRADGCELLIRGYLEPGGMLCFEVRDNGQGFPEPVDLTVTRETAGVLKHWGTGLYVTAQRFLLQSEGAVITLRSVPEGGTQVIMKQPLYDQETSFPG